MFFVELKIHVPRNAISLKGKEPSKGNTLPILTPESCVGA